MKKTLKDASRMNWTASANPTLEEIRLGALLRIADAVEPIARQHERLLAEVDYFKAEAKKRSQTISLLEHRIAALRGVITKLKKKALR